MTRAGLPTASQVIRSGAVSRRWLRGTPPPARAATAGRAPLLLAVFPRRGLARRRGSGPSFRLFAVGSKSFHGGRLDALHFDGS